MVINNLEKIKEKLKTSGPIVDIRLEEWDEIYFDFEDESELFIGYGRHYDCCGRSEGHWTELNYTYDEGTIVHDVDWN